MSDTVSLIAAAVADATQQIVKDQIADPSAAISSAMPAIAAREVATAVAAQIDPMVTHLTNNESWYRSRVMLGSVATMVTGAFGLYGLLHAGVTDGQLYAPLIVGEIGAGFAIYGRFVATKPLGA